MQTEISGSSPPERKMEIPVTNDKIRSLAECLEIYKSDLGACALNDEEVILLVSNKNIPTYQLEKAVNDPERGVSIRRQIFSLNMNLKVPMLDLPYKHYDYSKVS